MIDPAQEHHRHIVTDIGNKLFLKSRISGKTVAERTVEFFHHQRDLFQKMVDGQPDRVLQYESDRFFFSAGIQRLFEIRTGTDSFFHDACQSQFTVAAAHGGDIDIEQIGKHPFRRQTVADLTTAVFKTTDNLIVNNTLFGFGIS